MRLRPTRRRESPKAQREREAYEAAIAEQRQRARPAPASSEHIPLVPLPATLARTSDVETSHQAVPSAARRRTQQTAILALHREHPNGLTDDEVSVLLGDDVWRRCADLRTLGLLTWKLVQHPKGPTGVLVPATRAARSGRQARVSIIASAD